MIEVKLTKYFEIKYAWICPHCGGCNNSYDMSYFDSEYTCDNCLREYKGIVEKIDDCKCGRIPRPMVESEKIGHGEGYILGHYIGCECGIRTKSIGVFGDITKTDAIAEVTKIWNCVK